MPGAPCWVKMEEVGDTDFLLEEVVDRFKFAEENERAIARDGRPATGRPLLMGITEASLSTDSFISAASFQETTRVLTEAAISGGVPNATDFGALGWGQGGLPARALKENVGVLLNGGPPDPGGHGHGVLPQGEAGRGGGARAAARRAGGGPPAADTAGFPGGRGRTAAGVSGLTRTFEPAAARPWRLPVLFLDSRFATIEL